MADVFRPLPQDRQRKTQFHRSGVGRRGVAALGTNGPACGERAERSEAADDEHGRVQEHLDTEEPAGRRHGRVGAVRRRRGRPEALSNVEQRRPRRRLRCAEVHRDATAGRRPQVHGARVAGHLHARPTSVRLAVPDVLHANERVRILVARQRAQVLAQRAPDAKARPDALGHEDGRAERSEEQVENHGRTERRGRRQDRSRRVEDQIVHRVSRDGRRDRGGHRTAPAAQLFRAFPGHVRCGRQPATVADQHQVRPHSHALDEVLDATHRGRHSQEHGQDDRLQKPRGQSQNRKVRIAPRGLDTGRSIRATCVCRHRGPEEIKT